MSFFRGPHGPYLVAEIGGNHEGDFDAALRLADLAIEAGADAVKFQIYYGDTLVSAVESPERSAHFRRFELTPDQHLAIARQVREAGCAYVASVWDLEAFDWIDPVIDAYKIGSGDLTAPPFLRAAAVRGKPLMLATGLSSWDEVCVAVECIRTHYPGHCDRSSLAVLQCTSMYPILNSEAHLAVMESFRQLGVAVGYSDHTIGSRALELAATMGAEVLEFHFTDRKDGRWFRDHQLSLDSEDLKKLIQTLDENRTYIGAAAKAPQHTEIENDHVRSFRRAVYPSRDVARGEVFDESNLCVLRPNHGIDARNYEALMGRRALRSLKRHEPLAWADIE